MLCKYCGFILSLCDLNENSGTYVCAQCGMENEEK